MDPQYATAEHDHGDSSSTEEVESPRSVVTAATPSNRRRGSSSWRWWRRSVGDRNSTCYYNKKDTHTNPAGCLHSQVLRIKEEEMQISECLVGDHFTCYAYVADSHSSLEDVWYRSSLPASPLGERKRN